MSMLENFLPILPLRDIVVFPHMIVPLFVGRDKSIKALEAVMSEDKKVFLIAQKDGSVEDPSEKDLYRIGTLGNILQLLKLPDGTVKVLVEGISRAKIKTFKNDNFLLADVDIINEKSSEKDLSPIMLEIFLLISKTGAKLMSIPAEISSLETNQARSLINS